MTERQIADASVNAVGAIRAESAAELAFVRAVWGKLPEGSALRDRYAGLAAGIAARLDELDTELGALSAVRDELANAPGAIVIGTNGGGA